MAAPKTAIACVAALLLGALWLLGWPSHNAAQSPQPSRRPFHVARGDLVQEHYQSHVKRVRAYYEALRSKLKAEAEDLLPLLEAPAAVRHGYQILPKIIDAAAASEPAQRYSSYSWPGTDKLIAIAQREVALAEARLKTAARRGSVTARMSYDRLAQDYHRIRITEKRIDEHIQYNRLWQGVIASNRSQYDRETGLHDAVVERQAILTALAPRRAVGGGADRREELQDKKAHLVEREKRLRQEVESATGIVIPPTFVRFERFGPDSWVLRVPFYTDIEDARYVGLFKDAVERIWRVRDRRRDFRVELDIEVVAPQRLYLAQAPPQLGDKLETAKHLALFGVDRAVLTTGAITTHVFNNAIILGPHDITPRVLAHEFGHILGFRDSYFRAYRDLGEDGFLVTEVASDPTDIMAAPATGSVTRGHFEKLLRSSKPAEREYDSDERKESDSANHGAWPRSAESCFGGTLVDLSAASIRRGDNSDDHHQEKSKPHQHRYCRIHTQNRPASG